MPFLRMSPDNTLADTLGGLSQSLGNALNPMNQLRANSMVQEMQQRTFELQKQRALDAANAAAADKYMQDNPHNLPPADLAAAAAGMRAGNYSPTPWTESTIAAGKYKAAQDAAAAVDNDPGMIDFTPAERLSAKQQMLNGVSRGEIIRQRAEGTLSSNKASATVAATDAARTAGASVKSPANAALAAEAAASGTPVDASKIIAQSQVADAVSPPPGSDINSQAIQDAINQRTIAGYPALQPGQSPFTSLQPQFDVRTLTQDALKDQSKVRAPGSVVPVVQPTDVTVGGPAAENAPGGFSQERQGPDTAASAATASADTAAKNTTEFATAQLQGGITGGIAAEKVLNDVNQMRRLGRLIGNTSTMAQARNELTEQLFKRFGLSVTPQQSAREVFDNYKAALMGEWRSEVGIQRLALPEIQLSNISLPSSRMDLNALNGALDLVQAKAMLGRKLGQRALYWMSKKDTPLLDNANSYLDEQNKIYAPEDNPTETIQKERENPGGAKPPVLYRMENGRKVPIQQ